MTISEAQRRQTEERIRAAGDRLLRGQIPPGGGCDIQTLAIEAGVSRASLYRTYLHLKNEFEQRLARMQSKDSYLTRVQPRSSGSRTITPDSGSG